MTTDHTNDDQSAWSWSLIERTLDAIPIECVREHLTTPDGRWTMAHGHGWGWMACDPPGQPTELPPLPAGWDRKRCAQDISWGYRGGKNALVECFDDGAVSVLDPQERLKATELHAVLSHHLGLTAPAADVRALLEEALKRQSMSTLNYATDVSALRCAITEALRLLTGKGAPR